MELRIPTYLCAESGICPEIMEINLWLIWLDEVDDQVA